MEINNNPLTSLHQHVPVNFPSISHQLDLNGNRTDQKCNIETTGREGHKEKLKPKKKDRVIYSIDFIDEEVFAMETGLPNKGIFNAMVKYIEDNQSIIKYHSKKVTSITLKDQVLITLMKLRHNYTFLHLAQLFGCGRVTVGNIVKTFIDVLHTFFYKEFFQTIPSRHINQASAPASFQDYPNCRIIIDCSDVRISRPKQMDLQKKTYSHYRGMNSFKFLVGIAPNGYVTFVSKLYGGSTSDKAIFQDCGLVEQLISGDSIMVDKGFLIHDVVPNGVTVNIPPFLNTPQFTKSEILKTEKIARCRVHVERSIARFKNYRILNHIGPSLKAFADEIVQVIGVLVNLQPPIIKPESK